MKLDLSEWWHTGMDADSGEIKEALRLYRCHYGSVSLWRVLISFFRPLKWFKIKKCELPQVKIIIDCINHEKFNRIAPLIPKGEPYALFISDISTERSKKFWKSIEKNISVPVFTYPFAIHGYWTIATELVLKNLRAKESLEMLDFKLRSIQVLLHYQEIFDESQAQFLVTANEDSWIAPVLARYCSSRAVKNINVMHGRVYSSLQFYHTSVVFGRGPELATLSLASPSTQVLRLKPHELTTNQSRQASLGQDRVEVLFFDQPVFEHYSASLRDQILKTLLHIQAQGEVRVTVKLHPAQSLSEAKHHSDLHFTQEENASLLESSVLAIAVCSTVGIECLSRGVPIVYVNENDVLSGFEQIRFLRETAVPSVHDLEEKILGLLKNGALQEFRDRQMRDLKEEYDIANDEEVALFL